MGNKNSKQNEELLGAVWKGRLDDVKRLVAAGADKETKDNVSEFHSSLTLNYITLHCIAVFTSFYASVCDMIPPL